MKLSLQVTEAAHSLLQPQWSAHHSTTGLRQALLQVRCHHGILTCKVWKEGRRRGKDVGPHGCVPVTGSSMEKYTSRRSAHFALPFLTMTLEF